ncbi:MAG TPA: hypothetical protein VFT22_32180 [Kofleriaceae bacterium]|nr:hypothetical protein [Kofleriaceae bacterium]
MTRHVLALLPLALAACFQDHPTGQQELMGTNCYECHAADYAATSAPVHRDSPQVFSTACASCHQNTRWQPALEGLHGRVFLITAGPHASIACLSCHDLASGLPSRQGANTNCIQCHPDDAGQRDSHVGATSPTGAPYAYLASVPSFCLACHPAGTAEGHPDDLFRRRDHHAVPCGDCHDRSAGPDTRGANVTCVEARCHHTVAWAAGVDAHHTAAYATALGDGTSRNFCHRCHR